MQTLLQIFMENQGVPYTPGDYFRLISIGLYQERNELKAKFKWLVSTLLGVVRQLPTTAGECNLNKKYDYKLRPDKLC